MDGRQRHVWTCHGHRWAANRGRSHGLPRVLRTPEAAGRCARDRHDPSGRGPVLYDAAGRHGGGRDQSRAAGRGRRQPRLRATVRSRRRPAPQCLLRCAEPEQAERVRGFSAIRRQSDRARLGATVARFRRKLHPRHIGQVMVADDLFHINERVPKL